MTRALAHRGPDGEGLLVLGRSETDGFSDRTATVHTPGAVNIGLGHRRLAILDLSAAGHQPMGYAGRYWITYNGEVYNYIELRAQLEAAGYSFTTSTDTEVIMAAYDRWGPTCVERFNGMWAFALVDLREQQIFIARDRLGVKPFYFWRSGATFVFASEIKALMLYPDVQARANESYCRRYLMEGTNEAGAETAFEAIERLPAACFVACPIARLLDGPVPVQRYWTICPDNSLEPYAPARAQEIARDLRALLEDAVRLRLRSDVAVGSALSGGLDSSGIVSLVNGLLRRAGSDRPRQITFSSVYPDQATSSIDESKYISLLANALQVESHTVTPRVEEVIAEYDSMLYAMDTPPDGTCMSGWFTFKLVGRSPVSVTLEGQGADEQLAGYVAYQGYWLAQSRHDTLKHALAAMRNPGTRQYAAAGLAFGLARRLGLASLVEHAFSRRGSRIQPYLPLNDRLARDTTTLLATLLHYGDRASMAHGIESRMPYVDYRIAEFCARIPAAYKLHDGWTKYIARLALKDDLPPEVTWRRDKLGWPAPDQLWMRTGLGEWAQRRMKNSEILGALDSQPLRLAETTHAASLRRVIRRLNLAAWHDIFVAGQGALRQSGGRILPGASRVRHPEASEPSRHE